MASDQLTRRDVGKKGPGYCRTLILYNLHVELLLLLVVGGMQELVLVMTVTK